MYYRVTKYGDTQFSLKYEDEKLMGIIKDYIKQKKDSDENYFTYYSLCKFLIQYADSEEMLLNKERNTYYTSVKLSQPEYTRVSRLLWNLILDHKLFVDFSNNSYTAHYENDTVLGIF